MHDVHKPDRVTGTPMIGRLAISSFARQARQQADVPHRLDRLFRTLTVPIIPVLLFPSELAAVFARIRAA